MFACNIIQAPMVGENNTEYVPVGQLDVFYDHDQ